MKNIYYNPEKFNLEIVAEIEYSTGCHEFNTRVIWKDKEGKWYEQHSGTKGKIYYEEIKF